MALLNRRGYLGLGCICPFHSQRYLKRLQVVNDTHYSKSLIRIRKQALLLLQVVRIENPQTKQARRTKTSTTRIRKLISAKALCNIRIPLFHRQSNTSIHFAIRLPPTPFPEHDYPCQAA